MIKNNAEAHTVPIPTYTAFNIVHHNREYSKILKEAHRLGHFIIDCLEANKEITFIFRDKSELFFSTSQVLMSSPGNPTNGINTNRLNNHATCSDGCCEIKIER